MRFNWRCLHACVDKDREGSGKSAVLDMVNQVFFRRFQNKSQLEREWAARQEAGQASSRRNENEMYSYEHDSEAKTSLPSPLYLFASNTKLLFETNVYSTIPQNIKNNSYTSLQTITNVMMAAFSRS